MGLYSYVYFLDNVEREKLYQRWSGSRTKIKIFFCLFLWSWNRVFLGEEVHSILDFLECMASR